MPDVVEFVVAVSPLLHQVYQAFSLGSSFTKVMKFNNMLRYSEYHVAAPSFPQVPPQFIDDIFQVHFKIEHVHFNIYTIFGGLTQAKLFRVLRPPWACVQ